MRRAAWLSALVLCALLSGCELVADFDRSKIVTDAGPEPGTDGATPMEDAATTDDASMMDEDAGSDEDAGF